MAIGPEIIQRIETEVRKVLTQQGITLGKPGCDKRILAVFDAAQVDLALPLQQLSKCIENGYAVTAVLSDLAVKLLDRSRIQSVCGNERVFVSSEITDLQPFTEDFALIVIPILSYPMAAKLTLGIADTPCTYPIFQGMGRGDRIIAASDAFGIPAKSGISKLGQKYTQTLSNLGVEFVATNQLAETILNNRSQNLRTERSKRGRKVISASVIDNLTPGVRELAYSNPAIITPLARDLAAQKEIRLVARTE